MIFRRTRSLIAALIIATQPVLVTGTLFDGLAGATPVSASQRVLATSTGVADDDDCGGAYALDFDFDFYGQTFTELYINTNGTLNFDSCFSDYDNEDMPLDGSGTSLPPENFIMPFWDDLEAVGDSMFYTTIGETGSKKFIVQWTNHYHHYDTDNPLGTFQVVLYEATGVIEMRYVLLDQGTVGRGVLATVGIAKDTTEYSEYSHLDDVLSSDKMITFTPDGSTYTVTDGLITDPIYLYTVDLPDVPILTSPADGAQYLALSPELEWEVATGADDYAVIVATDPNFEAGEALDENGTGPESSIVFSRHGIPETSTTINSSKLLPYTTYYWKVLSRETSSDSEETSTVRSFMTGGEDGTLIRSCADLAAIGTPEGAARSHDRLVLVNDIDCSSESPMYPIGRLWGTPRFFGTFEGNGHTISNLSIDGTGIDDTGLFAGLEDAEISDLTVEGALVEGDNNVGAIAGQMFNSRLTNVHARIDVTGSNSYVGGLVGNSEIRDDEEGGIVDSSYEGDVTASRNVGGLVGQMYAFDATSYIKRSWAAGSVNETGGNMMSGGLVGSMTADGTATGPGIDANVFIEDSFSTAHVTGNQNVGGLVGSMISGNNAYADATATTRIKRSYSVGDVTGNINIGGLAGAIGMSNSLGETVTIENSFVAGTRTGASSSDSGSIVGLLDTSGHDPDHFSGTFYDGDLSSDCVGGSPTNTGCTEVNNGGSDPNYFKQNTTNAPFTAWDFTEVWQTTSSYPVLRAASVEPDSDGDGINDAQENSGPNGGDANNDGTSDSVQENVTVMSNSTTNAATVLESTTGCWNESATVAVESSNTAQDVAFNYPAGLVDFSLDCDTLGFTAQVKIYYYGMTAAGLVGRKYNSVTQSYQAIPGAVVSSQTLAGKTVAVLSYSITDGDALDEDAYVNGIIVDPAGVAAAAIGTPNTGYKPLR